MMLGLNNNFKANLTIKSIDKWLGYDNKDGLVIFSQNNEVNDYNYGMFKTIKWQYHLDKYVANAQFFEDFPPYNGIFSCIFAKLDTQGDYESSIPITRSIVS